MNVELTGCGLKGCRLNVPHTGHATAEIPMSPLRPDLPMLTVWQPPVEAARQDVINAAKMWRHSNDPTTLPELMNAVDALRAAEDGYDADSGLRYGTSMRR